MACSDCLYTWGADDANLFRLTLPIAIWVTYPYTDIANANVAVTSC